MAAASSLFGLTLGAIMNRDTRRAERLFDRMAEADKAPDDFRAELEVRLRDGDQGLLSALRALLVASLDAVGEETLATIAMVGRQYVRSECPAWIARGWVRLLSELTDTEHDALRDMASSALMAMRAGRRRESPDMDDGVAFGGITVWRRGSTSPWSTSGRGYPEGLETRAPEVATALQAYAALPTEAPVVAVGCAERMHDLMLQHRVAAARGRILGRSGAVGSSELQCELSLDSAMVLLRAFGLSVDV